MTESGVRRLVVTAPHTLAWETSTLPPVQAGHVRLRTRLSALSVASELSVLEGLPGWVYPSKLGYQTLGVIEEVGQGGTLPVGQRALCALGHASHGHVPEHRLIPVPDGLPDFVALCGILGEETHKGIRKVAPQPQESVLVAGAGLLGLLTVFNLTRRGVQNVTVLEPDPARRELAQAFGAAAFDSAACAPGPLPHEHFDTHFDTHFDLGFECSASPTGFTALLRHLRPNGRACVLSDGNWGALVLPPEFHSRELTLVASSDGDDYHTYASWLWQHPDPLLERLFQLRIRPDELIPTYARLRRTPRPVSVLVHWEG